MNPKKELKQLRQHYKKYSKTELMVAYQKAHERNLQLKEDIKALELALAKLRYNLKDKNE